MPGKSPEAKERWRAYDRARRKDPERRSKKLASMRAWRERNAERVSAYGAEYRRAHAVQLLAPRGLPRLAGELRSFDRYTQRGLLVEEDYRERCADHLEWLEALDGEDF